MATTPEGKLKQHFIKELKKRVKLTAVLQYQQSSTTVAGFPDSIILGPEAVTVFAEFKKSKRAKFQPLQKEWGQKLIERNFLYYLVYPENEDEVLDELTEILR